MKSERAVKKQGKEAENLVSSVLRSLGPDYCVFDNVMLKTAGGTTQIDHVVISRYGIFVIETKSHKGTIFGDCQGKYWTQCLYGKGVINKFTFYSPYLQNFGHLRNLYKLFDLGCEHFLGLIVFTSPDANLANVSCPNACNVNSLALVMAQYRTVHFTDAQVFALCQKLSDANCQSAYQERKHVKFVKNLQKGKKR